MKIKRRTAKIICCVLLLCLFMFCPVLAEGNQDIQEGRTPENRQGSVSADQMENTDARNSADPVAGRERTGGNTTDARREFSATVTLSDNPTSDIDSASGNGYTWSKQADGVYVLTLKNVRMKGTDPVSGEFRYALDIQLSDRADIVVKTEGDQSSVLEGGIRINGQNSYHHAFHLIFDSAALNIDGVISGGSDQDWVTVRSGSKIAVKAFNIGSSGGGTGVQIAVDGSGSELTIGDGKLSDNVDGVTLVNFLRVVGGARLTAESSVGVISGIELGEDSVIQINGTPALYVHSASVVNPAALEGIRGCLPSGYYLGEWDNNGAKYDTVLKPDGSVATSLALEWPEEEPTTAAPEEEPTTATPEEARPNDNGTEGKEGSGHSGSSRSQDSGKEPEGERETETEASVSAGSIDGSGDIGSKVLDASPYTGDQDRVGWWMFFALLSALALCQAISRQKSGQSGQ